MWLISNVRHPSRLSEKWYLFQCTNSSTTIQTGLNKSSVVSLNSTSVIYLYVHTNIESFKCSSSSSIKKTAAVAWRQTVVLLLCLTFVVFCRAPEGPSTKTALHCLDRNIPLLLRNDHAMQWLMVTSHTKSCKDCWIPALDLQACLTSNALEELFGISCF